MAGQVRSPAVSVAIGRSTAPIVDLVLLTEDGDHVVTRVEDGRMTPLRLTLRRRVDVSDLAGVVEDLAKRQVDVDVCYLGLLSSRLDRGVPQLTVAAVLRSDRDFTATDPAQRVDSLSMLRHRSDDIDRFELYERASRWQRARVIAPGLHARVDQAFGEATRYLENHLSVEDGRTGWNLYMDGSSIGVLSTAEGLLSFVHAGAAGGLAGGLVSTLEALQNEDGGWKVRRSLVGERSDLSITESTGACLWALHAAGRPASDRTVQKGLAWLEESQREDGGWASSRQPGVRNPSSLVFPTTVAVRALARFGRSDSVARGIAWLRKAQNADGGWGEDSRAANGPQASSPAYTAYAVVTLITAGAAKDDGAVTKACAYLLRSHNDDKEEPWASTSHTAPIDPETSARLEFKHFATPWAITALCQAGYDLSEPRILLGVDRLLALQTGDGPWKCDLVPPGSRVMWATHDALYALRAIIDAGGRALLPLAQRQFTEIERRESARLCADLLRAAGSRESAPGRNRVQTTWLTILTIAIAVLIMSQTDLFTLFQSSSFSHQVLAGLATVIVTSVGAIIPQVVLENYRDRRARKVDDEV